MIVWGGVNGTTALNDGGRYNPSTNLWNTTPMNTTTAPAARMAHTAVWSGTEMIVWGGGNGASYLPDGARFNNAANLWTPAAPACPLGLRAYHAACGRARK
jgi:N-acetylneuraminic acid mutarotase